MAANLDHRPRPSDEVRAAIRNLLTASAEYQNLDAQIRREIAQGLVKICSTAVVLATEVERAPSAPKPALSRVQSAGSEFSGVAAQRVASTTRQILNAVSFPRFVTELINGVFKALVDTNQQQMQSYVELIRNVASSTDGFADANIGLGGARQWLADRFPGSFVVEGESDPFAEPGQVLTPEEQAEREAETRLRPRPGASMPGEAALRVALGLGPQESVPTGDPENLVPLARASLARNRQQMLSTMVMLGLQRIVIESGRLHASMRFHIDTRSAATEDRGSQFDVRNTTSASGSFGYGPWGASASMTNTIGYVSTQKTQTTEEMNTDLNLDSSVELVFKTDYLPLDRLAGREQVDRIKVNTLNPDAERKAEADARAARENRITESETKRRESIDKSFAPPPAAPAKPALGAPGSSEASEKARKEAAARSNQGSGGTITGGTARGSGGVSGGSGTTHIGAGGVGAGPKEPGSGTGTLPPQATATSLQKSVKDTFARTLAQASGLDPALDDTSSTDVGEQIIYEKIIEHTDPSNFPIDLPEPGKGEDRHRFTVSPPLRFTRWEVKVLELSMLAGYQVIESPKTGDQGDLSLAVSWWHPPYGKIRLRLRAYASSNTNVPPVRVVYDSPGWFEQTRDQIQQGLPFGVAVRGENAERLHSAIEKISREQSHEPMVRQFFIEPATTTVVIVGLVVFAALAVAGLFVLYSVIKDAMDKGYSIEDTGYKFGVGEGPLRQEHELVFNLKPPTALSG